jgi:hypothetical protein
MGGETMAQANVDLRQVSFVSVAEAPVVAKAKPLPVSKERECLTVQTWGKPEEHGARSWLKGLVARMGYDGVAKVTGLESEALADMTRGAAIGAAEGEAIVAVEMPEGEALTREQRRSRRPPGPRPRTKSMKRLTKREQEENRLMYPAKELAENDRLRPKTRGECAPARGYDESGKLRPCGFIACRYHLAVNINPRTGAVQEVWPHLDMDVTLMPATCVLDSADEGGLTLEQVGGLRAITRERVRQQEIEAMAKIVATGDLDLLRDLVEPGEKINGRVHLRVIQGGRDEDTDQDEGEF